MSKENPDVLTATTSEGDTSFMVCRTDEENKQQKVCMDVDDTSKASASSSQASPKRSMMDNNTYDLMEQLLVENKSLWRIKNNYKNDSSMDNETKQIWSIIEREKEEIVEMLSEKLRERL